MFPSKFRTIKYCEEMVASWDENLKYDKAETSILLGKVIDEMFAMSLADEIEVINSISNDAISRIAYISWDLIDNQEGMEDALIALYEKTKNDDLKRELKELGIRFGIVSEYDEERLNELLDELDKYWNMFSDSRIKGEHPKCEDIQDEIKHMLFVMSDEQIRDLINNADEDRKEQLEYSIECILPYRPYIFDENYEIDKELVKKLIKEKDSCHLYDETMRNDYRCQLLGALGENETKAVEFIMSADKATLSCLSEIIEEILDKFHSSEMDKAVDYIINKGI